ncbi:hypothetical protein U1Q18_030757 [Sarracenia purpurea var. burkii]
MEEKERRAAGEDGDDDLFEGRRSGTNNSSICSKVVDEPGHGELVVDGGGRRWRSVRRRVATAAGDEGENRRARERTDGGGDVL